MNPEVKDTLYSLLDFLDSLTAVEFLNPSKDDINSIRNVIISSMVQDDNSSVDLNKIENQKDTNLIKIIYEILNDNKIINNKSNLILFAEQILDKKNAKSLKNKNIDDIINKIIVYTYINDKQKETFEKINFLLKNSTYSKLKNTAKTSNKKKTSQKNNTNSYINTWFNYFDNYKE